MLLSHRDDVVEELLLAAAGVAAAAIWEVHFIEQGLIIRLSNGYEALNREQTHQAELRLHNSSSFCPNSPFV